LSPGGHFDLDQGPRIFGCSGQKGMQQTSQEIPSRAGDHARRHGIAIALVVAGAIGLPDAASAQKREKKLSFEQAWAKCTPHAQQIAEWNVQARTARGQIVHASLRLSHLSIGMGERLPV
jgi:hypothetical protein